jgi:CRISPR-associated protein Cas2
MVHWVIYDITSDKKRNKIINLCQKMGMYRVQYSVFAGDVNSAQVSGFITEAKDLIDKKTDSVYILPMCKKDYAESIFLGLGFDKKLVANQKKTMIL